MPDGIIKRYTRAAGIALAVASLLLVLHFFGARLLSATLPFAFAFFAARLALSPARFLATKTRLPLRAWSVGLTLLLFLLVGGGAYLLVRPLFFECGEILSGVLADPGLPEKIARAVGSVSSFFLSRIPGGAGSLLPEFDLASPVQNALSALLSFLTRVVGGILSRIPSFLFALFVSVVAAVWFAADPDLFARLKTRWLPPAWRQKAEALGRGVARGAGTVVYAYGILFCLTFLILLGGLSLLGVPCALLWSLLIALFDLLPVLGAGGILIPWGIVAIVTGKGAFGACILFLSLLIFAVRQILTPRLVGRGLGIHPLLAFFAFYAGWKIAGATGVLFGLFFAAIASRRYRRAGRKTPGTE